MKRRSAVFASFFASLCAVCSFLALALVLGSLTGCSHLEEVTPPPPSASLLEPSGQPAADPSQEPQLSAAPAPLQSASAPETAVLPPDQPSSNQPPAQNTPAPEPAPAKPSQSSSENKLYAVLQGSMTFYSTDTAQDLSINELSRAVSDDSSITAKALKFAVNDLDGDGVPEAILWLQVNENDAFGFEILRQQNGQVYGYTLSYRSFMELKQDGTFSFSSGAADSGFGSISFSDKAYTVNEMTCSQSAYDTNNELTVSYFVNGQAASEAEYLAAVEKQNGKESVLWSDFTDENIASSGIALWRYS